MDIGAIATVICGFHRKKEDFQPDFWNGFDFVAVWSKDVIEMAYAISQGWMLQCQQ